VIPADSSYTRFPIWLELSGLPAQLCQPHVPYAWQVFRKIVELDCELNVSAPGTVEVSLRDLARRSGLDEKRVLRSIKSLRKSGVLRAFLPDNEEEPALFQVTTPVPTPKSPDEVRAEHPEDFLDAEWPPRYSYSTDPTLHDPEARNARTAEIVDLYFNLFSMKINSIILDELRLIASRYDRELVRRVFEKARKMEARSLSWILAEIRREEKVRLEAERLRSEGLSS
jgi:DNA-binding Lrp family transcriptional regulator